MTSGRLSTVSVVGAYWMTWQRRSRRRPCPASTARFSPSLKASMADWRIFRLPPPALMSSARKCMPRTRFSPFGGKRLAQQFGIGEDEIRRGEGAAELAQVEAGLVPRVLVDPLGLLGQVGRPAAGDEIELLHEIEELVLLPIRVDEAPVARLRLGRRRGRLAHHALQRARPQIEIPGPQLLLRFQRARRLGQPVFRDLGDRLEKSPVPSLRSSASFPSSRGFRKAAAALPASSNDAREIAGEEPRDP